MAIYPLWSWFTVGSLSPDLSPLPIFGNCLQHKGCKGGGYQSESIRKAAPAPGQCSCQGHCSSPGSILLPCTIHQSRVNAPVGSAKIFLCRYNVFVQLQSSCLHTTHWPCMYVHNCNFLPICLCVQIPPSVPYTSLFCLLCCVHILRS